MTNPTKTPTSNTSENEVRNALRFPESDIKKLIEYKLIEPKIIYRNDADTMGRMKSLIEWVKREEAFYKVTFKKFKKDLDYLRDR